MIEKGRALWKAAHVDVTATMEGRGETRQLWVTVTGMDQATD